MYKRLFNLTLIWYGFGPIITSGIYWKMPPAVISIGNKVDEVLILFMLLFVIINFSKLQYRINNPLKILTLLFLSIIILSGIINQVHILIILEFILRYGKGLIIFMYTRSFINIDNKFLYLFFKRIQQFFIIQCSINLLWLLKIDIIPNKYIDYGLFQKGAFGTFDWAIGSMGNCLLVAFISTIILSKSFYHLAFEKMPKKSKRKQIILFIISTIQIYLSFTNHLYFIVPVILFLTWKLISPIKIKFKPILIVVFLSLIIFNSFDVSNRLNMISGFAKHGIDRVLVSPKFISYHVSFATIPKLSTIGFFGAGPGQAGSYIARENSTPLNKKYYEKFNILKFRGASILTTPYTGITTIQSELGNAGILLFMFLCTYIILKIRKKVVLDIKHKQLSIYTMTKFITLFWLLLYITENTLLDLLQHTYLPVLTWILISFSINKLDLTYFKAKII